ncbi:hypothetical protein [Cytobacillus gottheilii]|uniref:hypothetical protein n=1 Tax=Cytobacillus gottheilii TaxID=859144 RepID=UPI002494701C|nr:hypothetical protein [Cytobacillus gottheilii]
MKKWQEIFLFMYESKATAGMYFIAFVFFYLVLGSIDKSMQTSLQFWTCIQLFLACLFIGLGQGIILSKRDLTVWRLILWSGWSLFITILFTEFFSWFAGYPNWYRYTFYGAITLSFIIFGLALKWKLNKETRELNMALHHYKENIDKI